MRLLAITDLHNNSAMLTRILQQAGPVDLVLLGGDITNFGTPEDVQTIVDQIARMERRVFAVAGNCDSPQIEQCLQQLGVSLYRRGVVWQGVAFQGLSAMPPWKSHMYHFSEDQLADDLQEGYRQLQTWRESKEQVSHGEPEHRPNPAPPPWQFHVVLSHAPPRDCKLDRTFLGRHVGSQALRRFLDQVQPDLVLCGHIHEGRGLDRIGRTWILNCGSAAGGSYGLVELSPELRFELRRI